MSLDVCAVSGQTGHMKLCEKPFAEQGDLRSLPQTDRWPLEDVMLNVSCALL